LSATIDALNPPAASTRPSLRTLRECHARTLAMLAVLDHALVLGFQSAAEANAAAP
jgi:hypothetical protein